MGTREEGPLILIADDDARNRMLLEALLRGEGFQVASLESGSAVLKALDSLSPDAILVDLMMPGMDGFEVVRRLKASPQTREIPVAVVTALDDSASRARLASAGITEIVTKPIDRWNLKACLGRLLGQS